MVCREARRQGLLVILDAKRGDLESTAIAYAEALLGDTPDTAGPEVDAVTVNPYLGGDGIQPFVAAARARGKGVFVLVRTSNPSAAEFQELEAGGRPLYLHVASAVARWGAEDIGASGMSLVGAVVGATAPEQAARVREILPRAFFLVPGYGAQGGGAGSVRPHFLPGGRGVIVNASRSIIFAHEKEPALPWTEAVRRAAEAARGELEAVRRAV
jgi:orotidine-5'-phosphate decarboxylase